MSHKYSPENMAFLRKGYKKMTGSDLTTAFNKKFALSQSEAAIKTTLTRNKITSGQNAGVIKGTYRLFTKKQANFIKRHYREISRVDLHGALNKKFNGQFKLSQVISFVKNHKIHSGRTGKFDQGHQAWNADTKGQGLTGKNRTTFKKGNKPANLKPLGAERICNKEGFVLIKVAEKTRTTTSRPGTATSMFGCGNKSTVRCLNQHGYKNLPDELRSTMRAMATLETKTFAIEKRNSPEDMRNENSCNSY